MKKILIAALLLTSCDDLFDTHPYDINFEGETGINVKQIAKDRKPIRRKGHVEGGLHQRHTRLVFRHKG